MTGSIFRNYRILPTLILLLGFSFSAEAQVLFEYRHNEGEQWHLISQEEGETLVDGVLSYEAEILNRISVEILEGEGGAGLLWNRYNTAEMRETSSIYSWSGEYEAEYRRDRRGRLSGFSQDAAVPTIRSVPSYPDYPVFPGEQWTAPGVGISDFNQVCGVPYIMQVDFDAAYEYLGPEERDGKTLHRVSVDYGFTWTPDLPALSVMQDYQFYPVEVTGRFSEEVLFDSEAGRNYAEEGVFRHTYSMSDGHIYTFQGNSSGRAVYVDTMDRNALIEEIQDLEQDIRVESVEDGVKISLDDINFVPDQPVMLPNQEDKLSGILDILSRYPDRDVQVIGHTARVDNESDGQVLSEQRAETVARLIIDSGVRSLDRITIRGMGNKNPIGDNSTEAGRRLNRRVEIIILEN